MKISASIQSQFNNQQTSVQTNGKKIELPLKPSGFGSAINGGELLLLSLATCFCNDIYREASKRSIVISDLRVEVTGEFGGEGDPGANFKYKVDITSEAPQGKIDELIRFTDQVAEVHNTLRKGATVTLE